MPDLCRYCWEQPVFPLFKESCLRCRFTCALCKQLTSYENGVAWDNLCDKCGVLVGSTPESPWKGE